MHTSDSIAVAIREVPNPGPERLRAPRDARVYQIGCLGLLLALGAYFRDFSLSPVQAALTFAAGLAAQASWAKLRRKPDLGLPSAFITCLSLSLLLRADGLWAHPLAAIVAVSAKFLLRVRGKHLFNPGNLGVIFALCCLPGTWVSPGQWGDDVALGGWFIALGSIVVIRARRADVTWAFLVFFLGALAARVAWLGQRWAVLGHQAENGALLLFAFFMISDPMTIPNHRRARIAHAALVAAMAYVWRFALFGNDALLWALFLAAPAVPIWDALWPAEKYRWKEQGGSHVSIPSHDTGLARLLGGPGERACRAA